jgi:hypothetical protein
MVGMGKRVFVSIILIFVISSSSISRADNELTLEAAMGLASEKLPFSPDWSGSVGSRGLLAREFAFKTSYIINSNLSVSSTFGHMYYWHEENIGYAPPIDWGWDRSEKRKVLYIRPALRLSSKVGAIDLGAIILREETGIQLDSYEDHSSSYDHYLVPVIGLDLGDEGKMIYGHLLDAFPLMAGGGLIEIGISLRSREYYEHKFFYGISGFQQASLGYRGEFPVYKSTAITAGFSIGSRDRENVYMHRHNCWFFNREQRPGECIYDDYRD